MEKSKAGNKYLNQSSREDNVRSEKMKREFNSSAKKSKLIYFKNINNTNGKKTGKTFWSAVKSFMTNKGTIENGNICVCAERDGKKILSKEKENFILKQMM